MCRDGVELCILVIEMVYILFTVLNRDRDV